MKILKTIIGKIAGAKANHEPCRAIFFLTACVLGFGMQAHSQTQP